MLFDMIGALIAVLFVTSLMKATFKKLLNDKMMIFVSFLSAGIVLLSMTTFISGFEKALVTYIPALLGFFIIDLISINRKNKKKKITA